jgi:uncharacterized protein
LKASGVPSRSLVIRGLAAIVGFVVGPVVGVFIGFVVGVYASEYQRVGARMAWPSTKSALRASLSRWLSNSHPPCWPQQCGSWG